ncbi:cytochrome c553 [Bosea sp. 124]|nr:cytochrome c553 [Bosea sp. 124]
MSLLARARSASLWLFANWRRVIGVLLGLVSAGLAGAALFAWLGVYNVAASTGHFHIVDLILRFGMENSVKARAPDTTLPSADDADLIRLGAGHFHSGCAYCHGAPGIPITPVSASMLPPPPDLAEKAGLWRDGELFWIVRHGLKYAGMPGWPALERQDEIWALVAFLRRLPSLDPTEYRALALGEVKIESRDGLAIATGQVPLDAVGACARCHGADEAPPSRLVPTLHGQSRDMIVGALKSYAAGERPSGVMQMAASGLSERAIQQLAAFYATLPQPASSRPAGDPGAIERGAILAREGVPSRGVPSCLGCHGPQALPIYPRLAGQSARYLSGQLGIWRAALNDRSETGRIMAPIARRLTPEEATDVAAFFASLSPSQTLSGEPSP